VRKSKLLLRVPPAGVAELKGAVFLAGAAGGTKRGSFFVQRVV